MKGPEAKLWDRISPALRRFGHCQRIESHATSIGVPDVEICTHTGNQWWIELKVWDEHKGITIRPAQKRWHTQRAMVGGKSIVIVMVYRSMEVVTYLALWGDDTIDIKPTDMLTWVQRSIYRWYDEIDFEQLKDFLYETKSR